MADRLPRTPEAGGSGLSLTLLRLYGVPIRVHATFALLPAFILWRGMALGPRVAALEWVALLLLFGCVLLHELGHTVVAYRCGIATTDITLYPFGGVARLQRAPSSGLEETLIAAAGPGVNIILAAAMLAVARGAVLDPPPIPALGVVTFLFWVNLAIAAFNLLPAYPLDGGRVLRGVLAPRLGWSLATVWAASAGQVVGVLLILVGVLHDPWFALGGLLILPGANRELRLALWRRQFERWFVGDLMVSNVALASPDEPLTELARRSREAPDVEFVVVDGGTPIGYLPAARMWTLVRAADSAVSLAGDAALPLSPAAAPEMTLTEAFEAMEQDEGAASPVIDEDGTVLGVISRIALERALALSRTMKERTGGV